MSLEKRVEKLEGYAGGERCPECGHDKKTGEPWDLRIITQDDPEWWEEKKEEDKRCKTCGRVLWFTFKFDKPGQEQEEWEL